MAGEKWVCGKHEMAFLQGEACWYCEPEAPKGQVTAPPKFSNMEHLFLHLKQCIIDGKLNRINSYDAAQTCIEDGEVVVACPTLPGNNLCVLDVPEVHRFDQDTGTWQFLDGMYSVTYFVANRHPENPGDYTFFDYPFDLPPHEICGE